MKMIYTLLLSLAFNYSAQADIGWWSHLSCATQTNSAAADAVTLKAINAHVGFVSQSKSITLQVGSQEFYLSPDDSEIRDYSSLKEILADGRDFNLIAIRSQRISSEESDVYVEQGYGFSWTIEDVEYELELLDSPGVKKAEEKLGQPLVGKRLRVNLRCKEDNKGV